MGDRDELQELLNRIEHKKKTLKEYGDDYRLRNSAIYEEYAAGGVTYRELASRYGVNHSRIAQILRREHLKRSRLKLSKA